LETFRSPRDYVRLTSGPVDRVVDVTVRPSAGAGTSHLVSDAKRGQVGLRKAVEATSV
jgi:hypothetical protein